MWRIEGLFSVAVLRPKRAKTTQHRSQPAGNHLSGEPTYIQHTHARPLLFFCNRCHHACPRVLQACINLHKKGPRMNLSINTRIKSTKKWLRIFVFCFVWDLLGAATRHEHGNDKVIIAPLPTRRCSNKGPLLTCHPRVSPPSLILSSRSPFVYLSPFSYTPSLPPFL